MKKISKFFLRLSSGWIVLAAFVTFLLFSLLTLPGQSAIAEAYSDGTGSPDTSLFYNGDQLFRMAGTYGPKGRSAYLHARWTFDLAFPLIYTFFLVTALSWTINKIFTPGSAWHLLNLIPLAAMLLDFLENSMTSLVMVRYPLRCPPAEILAQIFTPLKWLFVGISFGLLGITLGYSLVQSLKKENK